jgi:predicted dehydrogenase
MAEIRAGIIGLDTSHAKAFTDAFNNPKAKTHVPGVKVVAAYPSYSEDIDKSKGRVDDYKKILSEDYGVKMTASIPEMLEMVDVVLLESVDGRRHLPEYRQVAPTGKPTFIDKPFAASLADAKEIVRLSREHNAPCWSSSALRYDANLQKFLSEKDKHGRVIGCDAYSPAHLEKTNPGFFWYGIHGVEILFALMGTGCKSVRCSSTEAGDVAVGVWKDGRIGTMRGIRSGRSDYGASVIAEKSMVDLPRATDSDIYLGLIRAIADFFKTGGPPVPLEETLEICAFIEAAWKSSQEACGDVKIDL